MTESHFDATKFNSLDHENLTVNVTIDGITFSRSLNDDLQVDEENINTWLKQQPAKIAYWSTWTSRAEIAKAFFQNELEVAEAKAYKKVKEELDNKYKNDYQMYFALDKNIKVGTPKPNEPKLNDYKYALILDDEYQKAKKKYLQAEEVVRCMNAAVKAINEMRTTLMSLSANMRAERNSYNNYIKDTSDKIVESFNDSVEKSKNPDISNFVSGMLDKDKDIPF